MLLNYASRYNNVARIIRASLVAQTVKNLPVIQETWLRSLGWENPLEKGPSPVFLPGESHGQRRLAD